MTQEWGEGFDAALGPDAHLVQCPYAEGTAECDSWWLGFRAADAEWK